MHVCELHINTQLGIVAYINSPTCFAHRGINSNFISYYSSDYLGQNVKEYWGRRKEIDRCYSTVTVEPISSYTYLMDKICLNHSQLLINY